MPKSAKANPHIIDVAVGANIRRRRKTLRLSQEALAAAVGLTYQQIQKYENGGNRVSASMLYDISQTLRCDAGDLMPRGDWRAEDTRAEWLEDAQILHTRHPRLFQALSRWPDDRLRFLLIATRALLGA